MPRFYFHIYGSDDFRDGEGTELQDREAARQEAVRYAGSVIADSAADAKPDQSLRLEVTDESGSILFLLDFLVTSTAAVSYREPKRRVLAPVNI